MKRMFTIFNGDEIAKLRRKLGMTLAEFASHLDVSESAVHRWENGNRTPKVEALVRMNELAEKMARQPTPV